MISFPELPRLPLSCPLLGVLSDHHPLSHSFPLLTVLLDAILPLHLATPFPELLPTLLLSCLLLEPLVHQSAACTLLALPQMALCVPQV